MARYPLAAIAAHGPDNTRATKLVAAIFQREKDEQPVAMRKRSTDEGDARFDDAISADVRAFFRAARRDRGRDLRSGWHVRRRWRSVCLCAVSDGEVARAEGLPAGRALAVAAPVSCRSTSAASSRL